MGAAPVQARPTILLLASVLVATAIGWLALGGSGDPPLPLPAGSMRASGAATSLPVARATEAERRASAPPPAPEAALASAALEAGGEDSSAPALLSGRVVDSAGRPLAGARVELLEDPGAACGEWQPLGFDLPGRGDRLAEAHSAPDGSFALAAPADRLLVVRAGAEGYVETELRAFVPGPAIEVRLARAAALAGRLTRARDGVPVEGACVRVFHGPGQDRTAQTESDAGGSYHLDGLAAGEAQVQVVPLEQAMPMIVDVTLVAGSTARADVALEEGWTLAGQVRDARTQAPIEGAEVSVWEFLGKTVRSDARGFYRLAGARGRPGTIVARAPGYGRAERAYEGPVEDLDLELRRGCRLTGRVVDDLARPLARAQVVVAGYVSGPAGRRDARSAATKSDGRFVLEDVRVDLEQVLGARRAGRAATVFALPSLAEGATVDLGDLVLPRAALVRARVLGPEGQGLEGASVFLEGPADAPRAAGGTFLTHRDAQTDAEGSCLFTELAAGTWSVRVVLEGWTPLTSSLTLVPGEERRDVVWRFTASGSVSGVVRDAQERGIAGATVVLTPGPGWHGSYLRRITGADGSFSFDGVALGSYSLVAHPPGGAAPPLAPRAFPAVEPDGRFVEVELLAATAWIAGRVLAPDGRPVGRALVSVDRGDGEIYDGLLTDVAGRFRIQVPEGAPVRLRAWRTEPLRRGTDTAFEWQLGCHIVGREATPDPVLAEPGADGVELRL